MKVVLAGFYQDDECQKNICIIDYNTYNDARIYFIKYEIYLDIYIVVQHQILAHIYNSIDSAKYTWTTSISIPNNFQTNQNSSDKITVSFKIYLIWSTSNLFPI